MPGGSYPVAVARSREMVLLWMISAVAACAAAGVVAVTVEPLRRWLVSRAITDVPNHRSSHNVPTPRGGGLVVSGTVLAGWAIVAWVDPTLPGLVGVLLAGAVLAGVSFLDDQRGLAVLYRLAAQAGAVGAALLAMGLVPAGASDVAAWLSLTAVALAWLWFLNLYNFMDGIDGITGVQTGCLGFGAAVVGGLAGASTGLVVAAAVFGGAGVGFLRGNWHPARVFLGDVGSVPLGFLGGWLLYVLAQDAGWAAVVILPLYYLVDATITLARRALRGAPVWRAHREHAYQTAVARGVSPSRVVAVIGVLNVGLIGCSAAVMHGHPGAAFAVGAPATLGVWLWLFRAGRDQRSARPSGPAR